MGTTALVKRVWTHEANEGRRARQLAHALHYQVVDRLGRDFVTPLGERSRIRASRRFDASSLAVCANPFDVGEIRAWRRLLKPGDLFVDVGANVGVYTVLIAELGCHVIAVEPGAEAAAELRRNIALNGYDVDIVEAALSSEPGSVRFTVGLDSTNRMCDEGTEVQATTLDNLLENRTAAGVKIDVEGAERMVLEGGHQALADRRVAAFQIEWNDCAERNFGESRGELLGILADNGYATFRATLDGQLAPDPDPVEGPDVFAVAVEA